MDTFFPQGKEPITSLIQEKYLKHEDDSQNQVPFRDCIKVNYGVVYKEPKDLENHKPEFKLEGGDYLKSPKKKNKLTRQEYLELRSSQQPNFPYFSQSDKVSQIVTPKSMKSRVAGL